MKARKIILALFLLLATIGSVSALAGDFASLAVNGVPINAEGDSTIVVSRGDALAVSALLHSRADDNDVSITAFLLGDDGNVDQEVTEAFNVETNRTYPHTLVLQLPNTLAKGDYTLSVIASSLGDSEDIRVLTNVEVRPTRHALVIDEVIRSPHTELTSGEAAFVSVRLRNIGDEKAEHVRVEASIGDFFNGVSYVESLNSEDQASSAELYGTIPCGTEGSHQLKVKAHYNTNRDSVTFTETVNIVEGISCATPEHDSTGTALVEPNTPENTSGEDKKGVSTRSVLEIVLVILLVLFVVIAIVVGVIKLRQEE